MTTETALTVGCSISHSTRDTAGQPPSSSITSTLPPTGCSPAMTLRPCTSPSAPGRPSCMKGRNRSTAVCAGAAPMAQITWSASGGMAGSTWVPSRTVTFRSASDRCHQSIASCQRCRVGPFAARVSWPPSAWAASYRVTGWPATAASRAASIPAGPPPMTATDVSRSVLLSGGRSISRPARGFSEQVPGTPRHTMPTQP